MGGMYHCQYLLSEALVYYRRVLDIKSSILSSNHEDILFAIKQIAEVLEDLKQFNEAKELYSELLIKQRTFYGESSPEVFSTMYCLVSIAQAENNLAEAEKGFFLYMILILI